MSKNSSQHLLCLAFLMERLLCLPPLPVARITSRRVCCSRSFSAHLRRWASSSAAAFDSISRRCCSLRLSKKSLSLRASLAPARRLRSSVSARSFVEFSLRISSLATLLTCWRFRSYDSGMSYLNFCGTFTPGIAWNAAASLKRLSAFVFGLLPVPILASLELGLRPVFLRFAKFVLPVFVRGFLNV